MCAEPVSRRQALQWGGAVLAGAWLGEALAQPGCVVRPQQTAGPYFADERLRRSDIRSDPGSGAFSAGVPLRLEFQVMQLRGAACAPLAGAMLDLWQCDAVGVYSDVADLDGQFDTRGRKFLRGYQLTDAAGSARFVTVYPGWYPGRTVHIHFKVRGAGFEFTSQLYFDDALSDRVLALPPYASRGRRAVRNSNDGLFRGGGERLLLALRPDGAGYAGRFELGLQLG